MPITQQALDVHRAMSSRAWTVTEEYRIVFGKSSEITGCENKLEAVVEKSVVKTITRSLIVPQHHPVLYKIVVNTIAGKSYEAVSHMFP